MVLSCPSTFAYSDSPVSQVPGPCSKSRPPSHVWIAPSVVGWFWLGLAFTTSERAEITTLIGSIVPCFALVASQPLPG